jgi:hypothetical protein
LRHDFRDDRELVILNHCHHSGLPNPIENSCKRSRRQRSNSVLL